MRLTSFLAYWFRRIANETASGNLGYVPRRIGYDLNKRIVDRGYRRTQESGKNPCLGPEMPTDPSELMAYFRNRRTPAFHFRKHDVQQLARTIPADVKTATIRAAEAIVADEFEFRGFAPVKLRPLQWDFTPDGDPSWRRDLNRHFFFTALGFAYWYTGDSRFARKFSELSASWVTQCTRRLGDPPWNDPFEVAARINAWVWAYFLFLDCSEWDPAAHQRFILTLGELSEYLYRTVEFHRPGNHILLEAKALALCGGLFPEFTRAQLWTDKGWKIIRKELQKQVCSDGVHAERSSMYHRIIAGELSELLLFCLRNGIHVEDNLSHTVSAMADFERHITTNNGSFPLLGDAYASDSYMRFSAPTVAETLSNRDGARGPSLGVTEQTLWLIGCPVDCQAVANVMSPQAYAGSRAFPQGGYFVSRWTAGENVSLLVWDCGPLGYESSLYHGHSDALSVFIAINNTPIVVDPGTNERDATSRGYLCGTSAHNTVTIDGEDQSVRLDSRRISRPARAELIAWGASETCDVMIGRHDGYLRHPHSVLHTRSIVSMRNDYWFIFDHIEGPRDHRVEQRFHFTPGCLITSADGDGHFVAEHRGVGLILVPLVFGSTYGQVRTHETRLETAYAEMQCGRREPLNLVNTVCDASLPVTLGALLAPRSSLNGLPAIEQIDTGAGASVRGVEISTERFRDRIFLRLSDRAKYTLPDHFTTDARLAVLRCGTGERALRAVLIDCSTFCRDGIEYASQMGSAPFQEIDLGSNL